jgi:hypothetical protein
MSDEPYWEISGPRKYLNIPTPSPDYWRAAMTYGEFPDYKTVVGWGATEEAAKDNARAMATDGR